MKNLWRFVRTNVLDMIAETNTKHIMKMVVSVEFVTIILNSGIYDVPVVTYWYATHQD